ncbi:MAG: T9SS type A sorting domain-containing protein [Flavobacteriales bacterium]|nr:T9SS type A sorting domain-containing protein [Flavobacteriales bacterium]
MYPSPTSGPLHVQATTAGKMSVEVFNALGAQVQTANFTGTMTDLDLSGNAAGIYTVRVGDGTNFNIQRILLK